MADLLRRFGRIQITLDYGLNFTSLLCDFGYLHFSSFPAHRLVEILDIKHVEFHVSCPPLWKSDKFTLGHNSSIL